MCEHLHNYHTNLILNKAMCIDSLIAINSLNLAVFPVYGNATNKGKVAKLDRIKRLKFKIKRLNLIENFNFSLLCTCR